MPKIAFIIAAFMLLTRTANASPLPSSYIYDICRKNDPTCAPYLKGIFDGAIAVAPEKVCPRGDMDGGQLKEMFMSTVLAYRRLKPDDKPAPVMALAAFMFFMPCK